MLACLFVSCCFESGCDIWTIECFSIAAGTVVIRKYFLLNEMLLDLTSGQPFNPFIGTLALDHGGRLPKIKRLDYASAHTPKLTTPS